MPIITIVENGKSFLPLKGVMKKVLIFLSCLFISVSSFAYEFSFKITPTAMFPFLSSGNQKYEVAGGGAFADAGITLFDFLSVGPEFGFIALPKNNSKKLASGVDPAIFIVPVGVQTSVYIFPLSRLELGAGFAFGAYGSFTNGASHYAPWYRFFGDVNFRVNTRFSVGLNASWFDCQYDSYFGHPGAAGLTVGVGLTFKVNTEKASGMVDATVEYDESVFPLVYTIYKDNPIGTITIHNSESAEIRNVVVKFRAEGYTASEQECGTIKMIKRNRTEEVPLYADFTDKVLRFSEAGKISGEIVIEYELLGDERVSVIQATVPVYNRNTVRWFDPAIISSFVSTNSQEVLELSKYFVGVARNYARSGLNKNMQFAMYILEGLRSCGIICEENSDTPYNSAHLDSSFLDYVQYPYQTLSYRSGDKDDVAILLMSLLESVGIEAAYIPLEDDFIVAIDLGEADSSLLSLFNGEEHILVVDDHVWIPLSMSSISQGFMTSWVDGADKIMAAIEAEEDVDFIVLTEAWLSYPPSGFSSGESSTKLPTERELYNAAEADIEGYIEQELGPQMAELQAQIKEEGVSVNLCNKLGLLYVRAGIYDKAEAVYEISAKMGSVSAMNNLGSIYSLLKKYKLAKAWYEQVLTLDPDNETAQKNLAKIETELEE